MKEANEKKIKKVFDRRKRVCIMAGSFAEKRREKGKEFGPHEGGFFWEVSVRCFFWLRF